MSLLSGLGSIFHGIGHIFDGGDDDEEKKRQQQIQQQQQAAANANTQRQIAGAAQQTPQAPPDPYLNLVKAPGPAGPAVAQPQPAPQVLQKAPLPAGLTPDVPLPHASILHNISHNPVTGFVGGLAKSVAAPFEYLGKTDIINPIKENAAILTGNDKAEINTNRQSNVDLGLGANGTDITKGLEKWGGNSAGALLTVAAPGVENVTKSVVAGGVDRALPDITPEAASKLTKYITRGTAGGVLNVGFGGAQDVANADPEKAFTNAPENFGVGAVAGEALPVIAGGLKKFVGKYISAMRGDTNVPAPDELATGVKSSNPVQAHDAADQQAQSIPAPAQPIVADNLPAYQRGYGTPAEPPPTPQDLYKADQSTLRKATNTTGQTYDAGLDPNNPVDAVPAFQRRGTGLPPETETRVADIQKQLDTMPQPDESRSIIFNLKQRYGKMLRDNPQASPTIHQHLSDAVAAVQKVADTRSSLESELSGLTPGTASPDIRFNMPAASDTAPVPSPEPASTPQPQPILPAPPHPELPSELQKTPDQAGVLSPPLKSSQDLVDSSARNVPQASDNVKPLVKASKVSKTPQADLPDTSVGGVAKTGEIGQSTGKYSKGQEYEKASVEASRARGATEAANTSYDKLVNKVNSSQAMSGADRDTAVALQQRFKPGTPEHRTLGDLVNKYHTEAAQTLGTIERTIRKTASSDQLTSRFANKLYATTDDSLSIDKSHFDSVIQKNDDFVAARDAHDQALEDFNNDPSEANSNKFVEASNKLDSADRAAKFEEYKVASDVGKGSSNPATKKFIDKLGQDAGVYSMDYVDSSLLSSTRVMLNNFLNTVGVRGEESFFGKPAAAIARKLTGTTIGGGSRTGSKLGLKLGGQRLVKDTRLRQSANGNGLVKSLKNITTTGNSLGERNIYSTAYSGIYDHYRVQLKEAGYSGDELNRRALVNSVADPDSVASTYMTQSLADNAMASVSGQAGRTKIETTIADRLANKLGNSGAAKVGAKAVVRITLGFPTVVGRSLVGGGKRVLLGTPSATQAVLNAAKGGPPELTAQYIKNAVKEAGSGATLLGIGAALGSVGAISGSYPTDKDERAQWAREGKTENSIKIAGSWYSLPSALGVFALPFMLGANAGNNVKEGNSPTKNIAQSTIQTVIDSMPTESLTNSLSAVSDMASGDTKAVEKYLATVAASGTKMTTPLGSFVSEVAKMFDPTANDTSKGSGFAQFLSKVETAIPGLSNNVTNKTVDGNTIKNPNALETAAGAQTKEQSAGVAATAAEQDQLQSTAKGLSDNGVLTDNIRNVLDPASQAIFDQVKSGKKVEPTDMQSLIKAVTKNVDATKDTRFLSNGDYASNLAVLKAKRDLLASDPTTPQSDLDSFDAQIKRGQVDQDNKTPYNTTKQYKNTTLAEWRDMGDPNSDAYDPDTYQSLYDYDNELAKAGVAGSGDGSSKNKYYAKTSGSGSGSSKAKDDGNTIGSLADIKSVSLSGLAPKKIASSQIPIIQKIPASQLIKKRTISVS